MQSRLFEFVAVCAGTLAMLGRGQASTDLDAVNFVRDLAPVLQQKCVACHGPEKQRGGYRLDSFEWLLKPGDSGETPVAGGDPGSSLLLQLLTATDQDDRMPQKDDPLPAEVIERFRRWIAEGARFDGANPKQSLVDLIPPAAHPTPPEIYPHSIPVLSLAMLGDGQRLAIGGYHEVLVCELDSGKLRQRLTNLPERIHALLPVNDGRQLLYAGGYPGRAGEVGLIDLDQAVAGGAPKVLVRAADTVLAVVISPDGKRVAAGGADKVIRVIDLDSARELRQLSQHADWVMGLAFNHDGSRLASASRDGTARIFDPATGEMICAFREHDGPVFDVVFVGDGTQAASGGRDGRIRFWTTGQGEQKSNVGDLGGEVFKLVNSGELLLAAIANGSIREVSVKDRKVAGQWMVEGGDPIVSLAARAGSASWVAGLVGGQVAFPPAAGTEPASKLEVWPRRRD